MRKRRSEYLSEFVSKQYPIEIFKTIIFVVLDIIDNFIIALEEDAYISTSSTKNYEDRVGKFQRNCSSKIESLTISKMKRDEDMKKFIQRYGYSLAQLNNEERKVFVSTFIDRLDSLSILSKYKMHSSQLNVIRKSAIVKFSLCLGLNNFVHLFIKEND